MKRKRPNWNQQLVACSDKGRQAFLDGLPKTACPYGDPKQPYKGGSVTMQRRSYWLQGWEAAKAAFAPPVCEECSEDPAEYEDPRSSPLASGICLCYWCFVNATDEQIAEAENEIEQLKAGLQKAMAARGKGREGRS